MAQKYLMAMNYVDMHANNVLKKHAKKRPLGDIESKHRYTPPQPVLSSRTVDIDVSGTRTYRPKSSADIIEEQHKLIHDIYTKSSRNIVSAPQRRTKSPTKNNEDDPNANFRRINIEVKGRPLTSHEHLSAVNRVRKPVTSGKRPKTAGNTKNQQASRSFFMVRSDADTDDLQETSQSHRDLTNKIHKEWDRERDLNQGKFVRGQKKAEISTSFDTWLTFGGGQGEDTEGLIDAFARLENTNEYYNIEGGVGSKIAEQLQKGDKIRIGINGDVQSQDLKIKKWNKEKSTFIEGETQQLAGKGKMENKQRVIPLCWDDQIQKENVKVIQARENREEATRLNLCEMHPVVFMKLIPEEKYVPRFKTGTRYMAINDEGFQVRQRKKAGSGADGKPQENKITVITIEHRTEEEEKKLQSLTVDDVLKKGIPNKANQKTGNSSGKSVNAQDHLPDLATLLSQELPRGKENTFTSSKGSLAESYSSSSSVDNPRQLVIKPTPPTYSLKPQQMDLSITASFSHQSSSRPSSETMPRSPVLNSKFVNQNRVGSGKSASRGSTRSTSSKTASKSTPGSTSNVPPFSGKIETEYIQISAPVKIPNLAPVKKSTDYMTQSMTNDVIRHVSQQNRSHSGVAVVKKQPDYMTHSMANDVIRQQIRSHSGVREPLPSPEPDYQVDSGEITQQSPPSTPVKPITPALSINIPTAEIYPETGLETPHPGEVTPQNQRARNARDAQIDQITDLLVDAIIDPSAEETLMDKEMTENQITL
ncbi:hypothetical protein ACJMK2_042434 [Sinanodonta woodiana]|uniref:Uncharacterized protein n=1 Tax=Sinanodonta woodiana TaxID=1069815 RepID=A0ABD3WAN6_SINWO